MRTIDFQKFAAEELKTLRDELRQSGLDSFQCADLLTGFLAQHGYGVSTVDARTAALRLETGCGTIPCLQAELEKIALFM